MMSGLIQGLVARVSSTCREVSFTQLPGRHQGDGPQGFSFLDTSQSWLTLDPRAKAQPGSCVYHEALLRENKEGRGREKWQAAGS